MYWRRGEGIGSREQVVAWLVITSVRTEKRGLKQVRSSEVRVWGNAFWMGIGVNFFYLCGKVSCKVIRGRED